MESSITEIIFENHSERRKYPRVSCHFPVEIAAVGGNVLENPIEAKSVNISREGLCVRSMSAPVHVGTELVVVIVHAGHDSVCSATIVWREDSDGLQIYGLKFKDWAHLDRELKLLIETLVPEAPKPRYAGEEPLIWA